MDRTITENAEPGAVQYPSLQQLHLRSDGPLDWPARLPIDAGLRAALGRICTPYALPGVIPSPENNLCDFHKIF